MTILILGGTAEADRIAELFQSRGFDFVYSLAGVREPKPRVYATRSGGFGGAIGLARYISQNHIRMVIDATHPFAAQVSQNAVTATLQDNITLLRFERPAWPEPTGANWQHVKGFADAAEKLPAMSHVFLSVGSQSMKDFARRDDVKFVSRVMKKPAKPFGTIITAMPPYDVDAETALFKQHSITHLVTKNSGGDQTSAKLIAAQRLGIAVIMVDRPTLPVAEIASDIPGILAWVERRL